MADAPRIIQTGPNKDSLKSGFDKFNQAIDNANEALKTANTAKTASDGAVNTANAANEKSDFTQTQLDTVTGASTIDPAVEQMKVDLEGVVHPSPDARFRSEFEKRDAHLADVASPLISPLPFGALNVNSIWEELIKREVNPEWFGAVGDGTTDNTQAFTDTLNYLASVGGGKIKIPAGTWRGSWKLGYNLTTAIMSEHHNISIEGVGHKTILTLLSTDQSPGGELIAIRGKDATTKLKNITVRDLKISNKELNPNPGNGIGVTSSQDIYIENVWSDGCTNYGITVEKNNENINILNFRGTNNEKSGIALTSDSTRRVKVISPVCDNNKMYGMYIAYNTGTTMEELTLISPQCRNNLKSGIYCSHFDHSHIIGGIVSNNGEEGIVFHDTKGASINSTTVQNNGFEGIRFSMAKGCKVIGSSVNDNAGTGTNKFGIRVHNLSENCTFIGNDIKNINTTNQVNGIRLDANKCIVQSNDLEGNTAAGLAIGSGFSAFYDGLNYDANISGSATTNNDRRRFKGISIPTTGTFKRGDIIENLLPSAGGSLGWVCVADGTPGTWKTFGSIQT